ncbi:MAG TPA: MotA/TolQ/ExbB proton channel family protein [Gammaproteobacteria bacterium]|nr:MotA/TolQ/ExbB proton channel family protein [Gammaproteobacteria bacterium]
MIRPICTSPIRSEGRTESGRGFRRALITFTAAVVLLPFANASAQQQQSEATIKRQQEAAAAAQAQAAAEAKAKAEAEARERAQFFNLLASKVRELRDSEAKLNKQRVDAARAALQEQERLEREQIARRDAAEKRGKELDKEWEANEARIKDMNALLQQHQGNLGELFGVTRQIAGDAAGTLQDSMLSVLFLPKDGKTEERSEFMRRIAGAKELPSITELERLWYELQREMTEQGKVVRFKTDVVQRDGNASEREVVAVGPFTAVSNGEFLGYLPNSKTFTEMDGELPGSFRSLARRLQQTPADGGYTLAVVDPARGSLLTRYMERPNWLRRIQRGEAVGYVIISVGIIGLLLALFQYASLIRTRIAMSWQLRHLDEPKQNNPLGRLLLAFRSGGNLDESPELAELRLSEAVLREVPRLERFQSFLRLAVAAGPLLGLIGTVIGMIITFHAIVASGASDPKLMANGIGQAMINTVLGLGIAIPLLFINAGLTGFSRSLIQILDEHSQALLADRLLETHKGSEPAAGTQARVRTA